MQVRQVPDRQELGHCSPPCSKESSTLIFRHASKQASSGSMRALKKGIDGSMVSSGWTFKDQLPLARFLLPISAQINGLALVFDVRVRHGDDHGFFVVTPVQD